MDPDYVSHIPEYRAEMVNDLQKLEKAGSFWQLQRS
jgi:hypothetical protein